MSNVERSLKITAAAALVPAALLGVISCAGIRSMHSAALPPAGREYGYLVAAVSVALAASFLLLYHVVTRLRREVAKRTEAEDHASLLLESVGEGVLSVDESGTITFANSAAQALLGYGAGDIVGRDAREVLHHGRQDCPNCRHERCLIYPAFAPVPTQHAENERIFRKDGSSFIGDVGCSSLWSGGKHKGAVLTFRDVTERRETQERLRVQGAALEAAANSIIIVDRHDKIIWVNDSFSKMTGYDRDQVIGSNPFGFLVARRDRGLADLRDTIAAKRAWQGELATSRKDGSRVDQEVTVTPVLDEDGEIIDFIWIMLDVTERKRSSEALLQSSRALEEANARLVQTVQRANELAVKAERASAAKSEFLANMSHEIRTPMNAIIGASHLLRDTELSVQQNSYLQTLMISAELLLGIINDVLDFSKIEAGKLEIDRVEFSPQDLFGEILSVFAIRAEEKGLELRADLSPEIPHSLIGDPMRLSQILNNLLGNALKFTRHGFISLSVRVTGRSASHTELEFSVRDSGIGIAIDEQAQLFNPFTQVDGSITRTYGGTGLGLTISRHLADMMGGNIWLESVPGLGSTFSFRIPFGAATGEASSLSQQKQPRRYTRFRQQRVLLVEDNVFNQKVALALLERGGLVVTLACNGAEALELVRTRDFDMVLMDVQMPVMDGLTATREIRKLKKPGMASLPILAVSANAMENDVRESIAAGMNAHITKPFTPDLLYGTIAQWLGNRGGSAAGEDAVGAFPVLAEAIDFEAGVRLTGGDPSLYQDLLLRFELEYEGRGDEIGEEIAKGNRVEAARLAHSVKGVAGVLAAVPLQRAAQGLEAALKGGRGVEKEFSSFRDELARTMAYLRESSDAGRLRTG